MTSPATKKTVRAKAGARRRRDSEPAAAAAVTEESSRFPGNELQGIAAERPLGFRCAFGSNFFPNLFDDQPFHQSIEIPLALLL